MEKSGSWGQYPKLRGQQVYPLWQPNDPLFDLKDKNHKCLPYGNGLSYGDSCQNENGYLITTSHLDRFISFDTVRGLLHCQAGITLGEILSVIVPKGWILPVLPGTQNVTLGGAIANDIHGKNHWKVGSFGQHVKALNLRRTDNTNLYCSEQENEKYYAATIGGLGLTGIITDAILQLEPITSSNLRCENKDFQNIEQCIELFEKTQKNTTYMVAWLDFCNSKHIGRGIFSRAEHCDDNILAFEKKPTISIPFNLSNFLLNPLTIKLFNSRHYRKQLKQPELIDIQKFFFPLDNIQNWNRIYGKRGFLQYQCVLPATGCIEFVNQLTTLELPIFLSTLKKLGNTKSVGLLSFAQAGYTLAFDIPYQGQRTLKMLTKCDQIMAKLDGRLYPAKDARMSSADFKTGYPNWKKMLEYIDPNISSSFWQRMLKE